MKKQIFFTLITFLISVKLLSQTGLVRGSLIDNDFQDPVPFANIIVKETGTGTTTDFDGNYELELIEGTYTILFSFIGYETVEIKDINVNNNEPTIVKQEKAKKPSKIWQDNKFSDSDWNKLHQALLGVIESDYGTARSIRDLKEFQVAGKSGTAELVSLDSKEAYQEVRTSELLRDHSIIFVFGPMPNPRYAVSVVIENGESGGAVAGPVAIEVLKSLIND